MDPITHAVLGASTAQLCTVKKLKWHAWLVGALAAMTPDLDILIHSSHYPLLFYIYHRQFTHSLLFIPIGGLIVGLIYLCLFKSSRPLWRYVLIAAVVGYATHGVLDACTSYGTQLFWPFSNTRIAWDTMTIVDPIVTGILLITVIFAARKQSWHIALTGLSLTLFYFLFGVLQHERGLLLQENFAQHQATPIVRERVMPTVGQLFYWHGIYQSGNNLYLTEIYLPLFSTSDIKLELVATLGVTKKLPLSIAYNNIWKQDYSTFDWFSDGYVFTMLKSPLLLCDGLYTTNILRPRCIWVLTTPDQHTYPHAQLSRHVLIH